LLFAAKFGHVNCVKYLAERGADVKAKKDNGKSYPALNTANSNIPFFFLVAVYPLYSACQFGHYQVAKYLIDEWDCEFSSSVVSI